MEHQVQGDRTAAKRASGSSALYIIHIFTRCRMSGIIGSESRAEATCNKGQDLDLDARCP